MKDKPIRKPVALFLLFAFGLPLLSVFLAKNVSLFQSGTPSFLLYGFAAMTPTLSALIVTGLLGGGGALRAFLKKCYVDSIKARYLVLAFLLPFAVLTMAKLTSLLFLHDAAFITGISPKKLLVVLWALLAEELGWRGFLQPKLDARFGPVATPVLIGCVWALWHYYFFWLGSMSAPLALFALGCVADSFGYYWVTKKSGGNVLPASVWHFTGNLWFNLYLIGPEYHHDSIVPYLLYVAYSAVMAIGITIWGIRCAKPAKLNAP